MNVEEVVGWAQMFLQDFRAAHVSIAAAASMGARACCWLPPSQCIYKVNVGTAGLVGVEVVIPYNMGCVMAACLKRFSASLSIEIA